jgi:uncharacterized OsmC-like protein
MAVAAKVFTYAVEIDRAGRLSVAADAPIELRAGWSADHLLLAALARCTIESLRHHAGRAGLDVVAGAEARGLVTRRDEDGRYAFVEVECALDVDIDHGPSETERRELLARAERGCFVGNSLTVKPTYRWRVNGEDVD